MEVCSRTRRQKLAKLARQLGMDPSAWTYTNGHENMIIEKLTTEMSDRESLD